MPKKIPQRVDTFIVDERSNEQLELIQKKLEERIKREASLRVNKNTLDQNIQSVQTEILNFEKQLKDLNSKEKNQAILDKIEGLEESIKMQKAYKNELSLKYKNQIKELQQIEAEKTSKIEVSEGYNILVNEHKKAAIDEYLDDFDRCHAFYDGNKLISGAKYQEEHKQTPDKTSEHTPLDYLEKCSQDIVTNKKTNETDLKKQEDVKIALAGFLSQRAMADPYKFIDEKYTSNLGEFHTTFRKFYNLNKETGYQRTVDKDGHAIFINSLKTSIPFIIAEKDLLESSAEDCPVYFVDKYGKLEKKLGKDLSGGNGNDNKILEYAENKKFAAHNFMDISIQATLTFDKDCKPHYSQVIEVKYNPETGIKYTGKEYDYLKISDNREKPKEYSLWNLGLAKKVLGIDKKDKEQEKSIVNKDATVSVEHGDIQKIEILDFKKHIFPHERTEQKQELKTDETKGQKEHSKEEEAKFLQKFYDHTKASGQTDIIDNKKRRGAMDFRGLEQSSEYGKEKIKTPNKNIKDDEEPKNKEKKAPPHRPDMKL